jgi:hypothetical protein
MNDFREYKDYLMHYGVKGMKWHDHQYVKPEDLPGDYVGKSGLKQSRRESMSHRPGATRDAAREQLTGALNAVISQLQATNARQRARNSGKPEKVVQNQLNQLIQGFKEIRESANHQDENKILQVANMLRQNMDRSGDDDSRNQELLNRIRQIFSN